MRNSFLFLLFILGLASCTGKKNANRQVSYEKPTNGIEGIPGYIVSPKISFKVDSGKLTVEAPAQTVVDVHGNPLALNLSVWQASAGAVHEVAVTATGQAKITEGSQIGTLKSNADGSFKSEFAQVSFAFPILVVFISSIDNNAVLVPEVSTQSTAAFQTIPPVGQSATMSSVFIPPQHVIFSTPAKYTGNLGGLSGADAKCNAFAATGNLTLNLAGTWRAILSDSSTNAKDRIRFFSGASIKNTNGEIIVADATDLWNGSLQGLAKFDNAGAYLGYSAQAWTGSHSDGTKTLQNCSDWTAGGGTSGIEGTQGYVESLDSNWLNTANDPCDMGPAKAILYCINSNN